jgi:hypothetical protein
MTNSEILEEMMIHIHQANLIQDFKKKFKIVENETPNLEYHDKVFQVYEIYKKNGLII